MFKKVMAMFKGENKSVVSNEGKVFATQTGTAVDLSEVPDPVFASKVLGEGFAIIPTEGKVYSPVDGEVVSVAPSLHAYGIRTASGLEVLVHIGLETVKLNGEGFTTTLKQGDKVKAGELLAEVDLEFIKSKGCEICTPVVLTNLEEGKLGSVTLGEVTAKESIVLNYMQ